MKAERKFPIFNSHLDLAHLYWKRAAEKGGWAIDATCGNGQDTRVLSNLFQGVIALDIQEAALQATRSLLAEKRNVYYFCQSHERFPVLAEEHPISLIVYNLGYLPGGNKAITTRVDSTLISIQKALELISPGGMVCVACYPGHLEGAKEEQELLGWARILSSKDWSVCRHIWENRKKAPSLFLFQKNTC